MDLLFLSCLFISFNHICNHFINFKVLWHILDIIILYMLCKYLSSFYFIYYHLSFIVLYLYSNMSFFYIFWISYLKMIHPNVYVYMKFYLFLHLRLSRMKMSLALLYSKWISTYTSNIFKLIIVIHSIELLSLSYIKFFTHLKLLGCLHTQSICVFILWL